MNPTWGSENVGDQQKPVPPIRSRGAAGDCLQGNIGSDNEINSPLQSFNLDRIIIPVGTENTTEVKKEPSDSTAEKSLNELLCLLNDSIDRVITISDDKSSIPNNDFSSTASQEPEASSGAMMDDLIHLVTSTIKELRDISNTNLKSGEEDSTEIMERCQRNVGTMDCCVEEPKRCDIPKTDESSFSVYKTFPESERNCQLTTLVHPDLTKEKTTGQQRTIGSERTKTNRNLVTEEKRPRFADEIWTDQTVANESFITCPPELVEIYPEKRKRTDQSVRYVNLSSESFDLRLPTRVNEESNKSKLLISGSRASASTGKSVNFEDEMWPISPRVIGSKDLPISFSENISGVIAPQKLDENLLEATDSQQFSSIRPSDDSVAGCRSSVNEFDVIGSQKEPETVKPTHEEEHVETMVIKNHIDPDDPAKCFFADKKDPVELNSDKDIIPREKLKAVHRKRRNRSSETRAKATTPRNNSVAEEEMSIKRPETDCADRSSNSVFPEKQSYAENNATSLSNKTPAFTDNVSTSTKMISKSCNKEKGPITPDNLVSKEKYSDMRSKTMETVTDNISNSTIVKDTRNEAGNGSTPVEPIDDQMLKRDDLVLGQVPSTRKIISEASLTTSRSTIPYQPCEKISPPNGIVCRSSKDVDQTSESSAANSRNLEKDEPSIAKKRIELYEIHIPQTYDLNPIGTPPVIGTKPNAERTKDDKIMRSDEKKRKKGSTGRAKVSARRNAVRNEAKTSSSKHVEGTRQTQMDHDEKKSQILFTVPNDSPKNISVEGFKQEINNMARQMAKQLEVDYVLQDASDVLADVGQKMETNRQIVERIQWHQPNASVHFATQPDDAKSLSKALTRCRNFIQNCGYSSEAIEKVNDLLTNAAHSLKYAVEKQKTALITQEQYYARQSLVQESYKDRRHSKRSPRQRSSTLKKSIKHEAMPTLDEGKDRIGAIISEILKLTKKFVPKNNEKESPRRSPRRTNASRKDKSSPRSNSRYSIEPSPAKSRMVSPAKDPNVNIETQMVRCCDGKNATVESERSLLEAKVISHSVEGQQNAKSQSNEDTIDETQKGVIDTKIQRPFEATKHIKRLMDDVFQKFAKPVIPTYVSESVSNTRPPSVGQRNTINSKLPAWRPGGNARIQSSTNIAPTNQKSRLPQSSSGRKRISVYAEPIRVAEKKHLNASELAVSLRSSLREEKRDDRVTRICQCLVESKAQQRLRGGYVSNKDAPKTPGKADLKTHTTKSLAKFKTPPVKSNQSEAFLISTGKTQSQNNASELVVRKPRSNSRSRPSMSIKIPKAKITEVTIENAESPATEISNVSQTPVDNDVGQRKKCSTPSEIIRMLEELIKGSLDNKKGNENPSVQVSDTNEGHKIDSSQEKTVLPISKSPSSKSLLEIDSSCVQVTVEYVKSVGNSGSSQSKISVLCEKSASIESIKDINESKEEIFSQNAQKNCLNGSEIEESIATYGLLISETDSRVEKLFFKDSSKPVDVPKDTYVSSDTNLEEIRSASKSNTELNTSCSEVRLSTPSITNVGCGTDISSDDSVTRMRAKCCQASLVSLSSANISENPIALENMVMKSTETQLDSTESSERSKVSEATNDKIEQLSSPIEDSSNAEIKAPKKKFFNRHARSLIMLKEILSGQGLNTVLLDRAEKEMKTRRNWNEHKSPNRQTITSLISVPSSIDAREQSSRGTLSDIYSSKSLFGKLATLSESDADLEELDSNKSTEESDSSGGVNQSLQKSKSLLIENEDTNDTISQIAVTSNGDVDIPMGESQTGCSSSRDLGTGVDSVTYSKEIETATTEIETATTEIQTATIEIETATTEIETATIEIETATTEIETATTEIETATTEIETTDTGSQMEASRHPDDFNVICTQTPNIHCSSRSVATESDASYPEENRLLSNKGISTEAVSEIEVSPESNSYSAVHTQTLTISRFSVHVTTETDSLLNMTKNLEATSQTETYSEIEPSHQSERFSLIPKCETIEWLGYRIPKDIVVAFQIASNRARNLYEAINIYKENLSKLPKKINTIRPRSRIPHPDDLTQLHKSTRTAGNPCKSIKSISKENLSSKSPPHTPRNMATVSQRKMSKPGPPKTEFRDDLTPKSSNNLRNATTGNKFGDRNLHIDSTLRSSTTAAKKIRASTPSELSPTRTIRPKSKMEFPDARNRSNAVANCKANLSIECTVKPKPRTIVPREMKGILRRESTLNAETETITKPKVDPPMGLKKLGLEGPKPVAKLLEKSRIKILLKEYLNRSSEVSPELTSSRNPSNDSKQKGGIESESSGSNANELSKDSCTSCMHLEVAKILPEVTDLMDFLLLRVEENFSCSKVGGICEMKTVSTTIRKYKKPFRILKHQKATKALETIDFGRNLADGQECRKFLGLATIILSRDNLLPFIYGALCSVVFCCLQFTVSCEV